MKRLIALVCSALVCACSDNGGTQAPNQDSVDGAALEDLAAVDTAADLVPPDVAPVADDLVFPDVSALDADAFVPGCAPGDGCFLDPCTDNEQCQSGWCVQHLGAGVCTQQCVGECPPGWSCRQVAGSAPDVVWVCVSDYASLCRPCASSSECANIGGAEDACLSYGDEGSFCGAPCTAQGECPWGFDCQDVATVDGVTLQQCVNSTGVCPCTAASIAVGMWTPCQASNEFGTCQGKRVCTQEGLTACDALTPTDETCNGIDDDCDGDTDEPAMVAGDWVNLCDDANPCTKDECDGEDGCANIALEEGSCDDEDTCSVADHCEAGVCVGTPVDCDDENPCTTDYCIPTGGCEFEPNADDCDDGDPCTLGDECASGVCAGIQVACDCQADADCAVLEDGDLCNGTLFCDTAELPYQCAVLPESTVTCPPPTGPDAACLEAACDPATGACSLVPANDGAPCNDGDACALNDTCSQGTCTAGVPANCNDGNPCTEDSCAPAVGCTHTPNQAACDDGDACTTADQCSDGVCVGGPPFGCDDNNPCTDDACVSEVGCVHTPNAAACDDGNACTVGDHCQDGACVFAGLTACNDGDVCTNDFCDPGKGCLTTFNQAPCDDGDECTTKDTCALGACVGGPAPVCNDSNPCTDDACAPGQGCVYTPNAAACDDFNPCTHNDQCANGWCSGAAVSCDDANPCTDDACDPAVGCVHTINTAPCDDGNFCTVGDQCAGGGCLPGPLEPCDDDNFCNGQESCDPAAGCIPGTPPLVDDEIDCTQDACDAGLGAVVHAPDDALCPEPGLCQTSVCDVEQGCLLETVPDCCGNGETEEGEACDDGNLVAADGCIDCVEAVCGDGIRYVGVEDCDSADMGPDTCQSLLGDEFAGEVTCDGDCTYDTSACIGPLGSASNPAATCKAILDAGADDGDGVYFLLVNDAPTRAWCDMSGGWTLVTSWPHELTDGVWGEFTVGLEDPAPGTKHAQAFRTLFPHPAQARIVYLPNAQTIELTLAAGDWAVHGNGARYPLTDGRYLVFSDVHCGPGQGICAVNGNYHTGFTCDGNDGQVSGQGFFQECTYDEFCNCNTYGWKVNTGGCSATVCGAGGQVAVYLR